MASALATVLPYDLAASSALQRHCIIALLEIPMACIEKKREVEMTSVYM